MKHLKRISWRYELHTVASRKCLFMDLMLRWARGAQILMWSTSTPHLSLRAGSGLMTHFSEFSSSQMTWRRRAVASVSLRVQILRLNPRNYVELQQQAMLHAKLNITANQTSLNYKQILYNLNLSFCILLRVSDWGEGVSTYATVLLLIHLAATCFGHTTIFKQKYIRQKLTRLTMDPLFLGY
jgi:hypothetical protein